MRVGPFGAARGMSKLVRVELLDPVQRGGSMTMPVRWQATGATGELFPVLDADLSVSRGGNGRARLSLTGSYRPPFGRAGAILDRTIMHRVATATVRTLLVSVAEAMADPAMAGQPRTDAPQLPAAETGLSPA